MELKRQQLLARIEKKEISNIYFFLAEEVYFKNEAIERIKQIIINNDFSSFNFTHFYGSDANVNDIIQTANTLPVFSDKRLIIVDEFEKLKKIEQLNSYLKEKAEFTYIIFNSSERKLPAKIKPQKEDIIVKFYALDGYELRRWISTKVRNQNKDITNTAIDKLIQFTDNSLVEITNELEKLILFTEGKKEITEADVEYITGDTKNYNIFLLSDVLLQRDIRNSIKIFRRLFLSGESIPGIFYMLSNTLQKIWNIKYLRTRGETDSEIMKRLKINRFHYHKLIPHLNKYTLQKLQHIIFLLYNYDKRLKSTSEIPKNILIEQFIYEVCEK